MLFWQANFQIPNSGVQSEQVYAIVEDNTTGIVVNFYSDNTQQHLLFSKNYPSTSLNPYDYLLSLEEFSNYVKV